MQTKQVLEGGDDSKGVIYAMTNNITSTLFHVDYHSLVDHSEELTISVSTTLILTYLQIFVAIAVAIVLY